MILREETLEGKSFMSQPSYNNARHGPRKDRQKYQLETRFLEIKKARSKQK
jgi:hypothetical protein